MAFIRRSRKPPAVPAGQEDFARKLLRFRQILLHYGRLLDIHSDMAEKQGGGFIHDRQYLVSRAEELFGIIKATLLDLLILSGKRHIALLEILERLEENARKIVSMQEEKIAEEAAEVPSIQPQAPEFDTKPLARALAKATVFFHNTGQAVSRGVAVGEVLNIEKGGNLTETQEKKILVLANLDEIDGSEALAKMMEKASAFLADAGDVAGNAANEIRACHIPAITGLEHATGKLATGDKITVDAEESTVYQGNIEELAEHYRLFRQAAEEEFEYQMLRKFRREVFPLTITQPGKNLPGPQDVKTLHDLVHIAHELAGDEIAQLAFLNAPPRKRAAAPDCQEPSEFGLQFLPSFLENIEKYERSVNFAPVLKDHPDAIRAEAGGNGLNLLMPLPDSSAFDMIDTAAGKYREANYIYCRFSSRASRRDRNCYRRDLAKRFLWRLGFTVAATNRAVTAWLSRLDRKEVELGMYLIGRWWRLLKEEDLTGWPEAPRPEQEPGFNEVIF